MRERDSLFNEYILEVRKREKEEKILRREQVSPKLVSPREMGFIGETVASREWPTSLGTQGKANQERVSISATNQEQGLVRLGGSLFFTVSLSLILDVVHCFLTPTNINLYKSKYGPSEIGRFAKRIDCRRL